MSSFFPHLPDSAIINFEVRVGLESKDIKQNALCRKVMHPPYPDKQHSDYSVHHFDCGCPVAGRYASIMKIGGPNIALVELRFYGW
ncbi:unnamed protein product [Cyprideis torosa]|uniref:Uncharacterized protein n=1 Tax=Cyprideis torosa TaxID=163714 RepID=A0A7R8WWL9_9CRUS|nr:unnamed protein product [Cyprideis torosa]CAG0908394.1 unnamed protein product [Cyprideis torosa]